ncbi:methylated-DNA--[protein]-cysteine S-methyltransferase [Endozoicomonas sp. SM1973]|uniref:Methylated-DNA--protein-cysteine methyltransferase n=1 Tax=Spartinivicinus marinus TaxID=2994442 RepID=A0A853IE30_9GAMM|nr:methylated-DNA--[protein]-cysteine S-methyltransferase [Spartinivicinus marinus]MCX4028451.1 methylated-DNA--[protein]-cysteine S-methyltransferase [Spartinivicinus marinus]NYZ67435.1 methylated-DNA--[protein]-cysteine S-methyltransferase [Spartinivicinus marinus]
MNKINIQYYHSPCGKLILGEYNGQLCLCDWQYREARTTVDNRLTKRLNAIFVEEDSDILQAARQQLTEYFNAERNTFAIPLLMVGTPFQKTVWQALTEIPFGSTTSYLQLAEKIGNKRATRAVANANGANAISIFIPCHRIIGNNGKLVGYAGGLEAKQKLLHIEQQ